MGTMDRTCYLYPRWNVATLIATEVYPCCIRFKQPFFFFTISPQWTRTTFLLRSIPVVFVFKPNRILFAKSFPYMDRRCAHYQEQRESVVILPQWTLYWHCFHGTFAKHLKKHSLKSVCVFWVTSYSLGDHCFLGSRKAFTAGIFTESAALWSVHWFKVEFVD